MTMIKKFAVLAAATAAFAATPAAAQDSSADGTATVNIVSPMTLTNTAALDFGTVITSGTAGSVSLDASDGRSCVNVTCAGTIASSAAFNLAATVDSVVEVRIPSTVQIDHASLAGVNILVDLEPELGVLGAYETAPGSGIFVFTMPAADVDFTFGGTAPIAAAQADGVYSGDFTVEAAYQ